jgi:hypothetical protein
MSHEHVCLYWVWVCIICMYLQKKLHKLVCINPLSRIHNTSLISAYFRQDSRECKCLEYLFINHLTAGWSNGLRSRLRNQRFRVHVPEVGGGFCYNYTCSRVMAVYIYIVINITYICTIYVCLSIIRYP